MAIRKWWRRRLGVRVRLDGVDFRLRTKTVEGPNEPYDEVIALGDFEPAWELLALN
jgi:hypothetical protein